MHNQQLLPVPSVYTLILSFVLIGSTCSSIDYPIARSTFVLKRRCLPPVVKMTYTPQKPAQQRVARCH